jgi:hypothetical protein
MATTTTLRTTRISSSLWLGPLSYSMLLKTSQLYRERAISARRNRWFRMFVILDRSKSPFWNQLKTEKLRSRPRKERSTSAFDTNEVPFTVRNYRSIIVYHKWWHRPIGIQPHERYQKDSLTISNIFWQRNNKEHIVFYAAPDNGTIGGSYPSVRIDSGWKAIKKKLIFDVVKDNHGRAVVGLVRLVASS